MARKVLIITVPIVHITAVLIITARTAAIARTVTVREIPETMAQEAARTAEAMEITEEGKI